MEIRNLFVILFLATCSFMTFAQKAANETPIKTIELTVSKNTLFDGIIDYLQDNSFFLMSMDKQAGFIQAKIYIPPQKKLSAKVGERRTLNFIVRSTKENQSKLSLNIYCEEKYFCGDFKNETYFYKERGVSKDASIYKIILNGLLEAVKTSNTTLQKYNLKSGREYYRCKL